jgi:hypothetical protein
VPNDSIGKNSGLCLVVSFRDAIRSLTGPILLLVWTLSLLAVEGEQTELTGGGCGLGSGLAALALMAFMFLRARLR